MNLITIYTCAALHKDLCKIENLQKYKCVMLRNPTRAYLKEERDG